MSKYIYKFNTYADYLAAKDTLEIPSVSYVKDMEVVISNGIDEVSSEMPERVAAPTVTFASNKFTVECATEGSTIYYTIGAEEPADPTIESSVYTGPIRISENEYMKCFAVKYGMIKSEVAEEYGEYVAPSGDKIYYEVGSGLAVDFTPTYTTAFDASYIKNDWANQCFLFDGDVTEIKEDAFIYRKVVQSLTIPATVTKLGNHSLYCSNNSKACSIIFASTTPATLDGTVFDNDGYLTIYVPASAVDAYKAAWTSYAKIIKATA